MKKAALFMSAIIMLAGAVHAQGGGIKIVNSRFDNKKLSISYEIDGSTSSDLYFVWLEMGKKATGEKIVPKSLTGDIGEKITGGNGKLIEWTPATDSVILDEEVEFEIKAEKYEKSFNRGTGILLSAVLPGLGQTKINGKPWWLTGIVSYGLIAGGFVMRKQAEADYDKYLDISQDASARANMYDQAQKKMDMAGTFIISGAAIWAANMIWISSVPNRYKGLKHLSLKTQSLDKTPYTMVSYKINF
jgi:hypothetical protein